MKNFLISCALGAALVTPQVWACSTTSLGGSIWSTQAVLKALSKVEDQDIQFYSTIKLIQFLSSEMIQVRVINEETQKESTLKYKVEWREDAPVAGQPTCGEMVAVPVK